MALINMSEMYLYLTVGGGLHIFSTILMIW